ncbi:hypothetical protein G4B84_003087 [Aspergillus flavus NRRL3357]|nr:uncharacterized protein G4B84_003087 [Aspergillus flavus NRRL3357]QMW27798.1 hypothetical protein G4B84_003087 [Aspergillus flavus NRRL3357]QMW39869.1 hypothetical protein G4B11_003149 [Aspergillus flavus]
MFEIILTKVWTLAYGVKTPSSSPHRDTLQRHTSTHSDQQNQALLASRAKRPRSNRACQSCAREKQRCSGNPPCTRCINKNRTCVFDQHSRGGNDARNRSSTVHVSSQDGTGHAEMSFSGDISKSGLLPGDQQLVGSASVQALPEIRPFSDALGYPNYIPDLGNLFTWGPFDCLDDPQYNPSLNNGVGFGGLDSLCQQVSLPSEPSVLQTPRSSTPLEPATLHSLPTPAEGIHQSSQTASHVLKDPTAYSSASSRGDPDPQSGDDILIAENFFHVRAVDNETYEKIHGFYLAQTDICFKKLAFPDVNHLNCLVQVYFEYFHAQMPFVHPVMLENDGSWILVLAVAVIGSQYTRMAMGKQYIIVLSELLRRAIPLDAVKALQYDAMTLAQSTLLLNVNLVFNGFRDDIINLQFLRTWLATLIRPFLKPHSKRDPALLHVSRTGNTYDRWHAWLQAEAHARLVYAFFLLDSFCVVFHDMPPSYSVDDFEHRLPSPDELWSSQDAHSWESHLQSCQEPPEITLREFLSSSCSNDHSLEQLPWFNRLVLLLGLFVGEKQAVNISQSSARFLVSSGSSCTLPYLQETPNSSPSLDPRYQVLESNFTPTKSAAAFADCFTICYNLASIFRYASVRDILAYTGWLATNVESIAAGKRIAQVMEKDNKRARRCVIHAGAIIREIRGVSAPACYHCFSLLFAFLYLWAYERIHASTTAERPHSNQSAPHTLLRIDRDPDPVLEKQWIAGDADCRPYLTGVGLLLEPGASTRLLRECQRILRCFDAWPHLRTGFIYSLDELVDEVKPLTDPPYSWAS